MRIKQCSALIVFLFVSFINLQAQTPEAVKQLLSSSRMKGASFSVAVKDISGGGYLYSYDVGRLLTPASIIKAITTATALEMLGDDYSYATRIEYDGTIENGTLKGNIYILGSGDPSLGSSHISAGREAFLDKWVEAVKGMGIKRITGRVVADEGVFDTEGASPKWTYEDLANYYGAGSYGVSLFDNLYQLYFRTGAPGSVPEILRTEPHMDIKFHNYLRAAAMARDSAWIIGAPYGDECFLYGTMSANRSEYSIKGAIPDPPLFAAKMLDRRLASNGITLSTSPTTRRLLAERGEWRPGARKEILTTYSPPLRQLVEICNFKSHNLYADAMLKTIGLQYKPSKGEVVSSFGRGINAMKSFWKSKGIDLDNLSIADGSGLAPTDKITAHAMCEILAYMYSKSENQDVFFSSLPACGEEGSVRSLFKGTRLQGKARMKSGGMAGVRTFAGYIPKNGKMYSVVIMCNNYGGSMAEMTKAFETLLLKLL